MADRDPVELHEQQQFEEVPATEAPKLPELDKRRKRKKILLGLAAAIVVIGGAWWLMSDGDHVTTDNAYVNADSAQVTALVSGPVRSVEVVNTQVVRRGQILFRLDDSDARLALAKAEAEYLKARKQFGQISATSGSLAAQIGARDADIGQAQAQLAAAGASLAKARIDLNRRSELVESGAVSKEELTTAQNAYSTAQANVSQARAAVAQASASRGAARESWAANEALIAGTSVDTSPDVAAAKARLDQARLDHERTVIRAPIDGVVTNRQIQVGQRIAAGSAVMTIVPVGSAYVDANFKEGQLARVRPGQKVALKSDLYGGDVVYHGRVVGFSGGTGSAFALIPAQNATGNWIKVVQRLPVRIVLDPKELAQHPLRVGLSMEAEIDVSGAE
ncbi:HlyD family efflux transporter periplasmic adaptor subunit [Sphingomonas sp. RB56-2]|uniref:HlyD family efflux transporter periplasmic adaptor subunit n=1 Tax=Sphingomonas brevis TaxID=2908206 RepID=A0ABT0S8Y8_9SPHN|nr:HlyD family efflux transporter periplasmic adaptor subunit [Sphingomonas brevis]MCL6740876.1 HlyD family efflux transporter periplasmic adaptor subunit [Sphingomonas brevis]